MAELAAWAVDQAAGGWFLTATQAPGEWQRRRQKVRDLRRALRKSGHLWELAWVTERGRGGMIHIHGMQHGTEVPTEDLFRTWGSRVSLEPIINTVSTSRYLTKGALAGGESLEGHLELNGGRAMHWTTGFLRGHTKRSALKLMRSEHGDLTWHREPAPSTVSLHMDKK